MVTEQLPTPATGLSQCVTDLESSGYCYLAAALSTAEVLQLQQRLSEQAQAEEQHGVAYKDGAPNQNWGDFRDEQGELRPAAFDPDAISIAATAPAGTALVVDGRTWHGTGANIGGGERRAVLTTFCAPQFRPQENYTVGTRAEVLARADDDLRTLLGLKIWNAYGRTGHPTDKFISPGAELIGELSPA